MCCLIFMENYYKLFRLCFISFLLVTFSVFTSCNFKTTYAPTNVEKGIANSIEDIKAIGKLRVALSYSPTGFFVYKGSPMGFQYDLVNKLASSLNVELEVTTTEHEDEQLALLKNRKVDLIADNFEHLHYTEPYIDYVVNFKKSNLVLVQKKKRNSAKKIDDLQGKTVHIAQQRAHLNCINQLNKNLESDIFVWDVDEKVTPYQLAEQVSNGNIDYAIVEQHLAKLLKSRYKNIDVNLKLTEAQPFGWLTNNKAKEITQFVDDWVLKQKNVAYFNNLYNKYYNDQVAFNTRVDSKYFSHITGKISKYDELIQEYANEIDWRLVAALIHQESRFNPNAKSWAGASGLMQLMPKTAAQYGCKNLFDPEANIKAGIKHFNWLEKYWSKKITDENQRIKFILASYNVGHGHVNDAIKLAEKFGKNPLIWDDNVAEFILKKSDPQYYKDTVVKYGYCRGKEPFNYVRIVTNRFKQYKQYIHQEEVVVSASETINEQSF